MAIREEVSGTGSMSKRTDLNVSKQRIRYISGMSSMGQTTGQEVLKQQQGADMLAMEETPEIDLPPIVSFQEPTQFVDEPDDYGSSWGPNPGREVMPSVNAQVNTLNLIYKMMQYDSTGAYEAIYNKLNEV